MPFTVSHVAAVVPAYRPLTRAHLFSAAVIGSMVPDFGMLLPGAFERWQTHSLAALLTFCLPMGLLTYGVWQLLIKPALLEVLPDGAYLRLAAEHPQPDLGRIATWVYAASAVLLGALTHLVWDGFTHENARGVRFFPSLADYGPEMAGHSLQLYRWLQYGSSVLGLVVVVGAVLLWWRHAPAPKQPLVRRLGPIERALFGSLYPALPLVALLLSVFVALSLGRPVLTTGEALGGVAVLSMRACALSALLVSSLIRLRVGR